MTISIMSEFTKKIYGIIQDKIFFSNISGNPVEVVEKLPEEIVPGKVLFDIQSTNYNNSLFCNALQFCKIYFINL